MTVFLKATKNKKTKRVGRGGKRGKTAGRGTKGQKARAGHRIRPHIRDIIKKLPKLRGRGKNSNKAFRQKPCAVNLSTIDSVFMAGALITPGSLVRNGLASRTGGVLPLVKILSTGELTKAFTFRNVAVSAAAQKKIVAAGGTIK